MKHRRLLVLAGVVGAAALVIFLSVAAASSNTPARTHGAAAVKAPKVPNAKAIRAKYGGQKITFVGDSVGLHPMTVIVSIFIWSLLIGGLLGPLLAIPLTATIKVLLARYVWGRRLREEVMETIEEVPVVEAEHEPEAVR